jgi:hypothetical protein
MHMTAFCLLQWAAQTTTLTRLIVVNDALQRLN